MTPTRRGLVSFTVIPTGATLPAAIVSDGVAPGATVPVVCLEENEKVVIGQDIFCQDHLGETW